MSRNEESIMEEGIPLRPVGFDELIRRHLRELREQASLSGERVSQPRVARAMEALGFNGENGTTQWTRGIVNNVELGERRVSLLELCGLSIAFGVPLMLWLLPIEPDVLELPNGQALNTRATEQLLVGRSVSRDRPAGLGIGGASDWTLAEVLAAGVPRPLAESLWASAAIMREAVEMTAGTVREAVPA